MANRKNRAGKAGLILSIIALVVGWIPYFGWIIGGFLWVLAMTFSCIGLVRFPRGAAIAGIIICLIDIVVIIVFATVLATAILAAFSFS